MAKKRDEKIFVWDVCMSMGETTDPHTRGPVKDEKAFNVIIEEPYCIAVRPQWEEPDVFTYERLNEAMNAMRKCFIRSIDENIKEFKEKFYPDLKPSTIEKPSEEENTKGENVQNG